LLAGDNTFEVASESFTTAAFEITHAQGTDPKVARQQNSGPNRRDYALPAANDSRECTSPMGFELVYVET